VKLATDCGVRVLKTLNDAHRGAGSGLRVPKAAQRDAHLGAASTGAGGSPIQSAISVLAAGPKPRTQLLTVSTIASASGRTL
jgi:hypothetical protein